MIRSLFQLRRPSLLRGNVLVLGSLAASFFLAKFPLNRATPTMILPILFAAAGMADTLRCIRRRWSWYHGAVMLSLYMGVMVMIMILFLALYPLLMRIG
ncbi:MAG: permease [Acidobacteriaceae bacterium]